MFIQIKLKYERDKIRELILFRILRGGDRKEGPI